MTDPDPTEEFLLKRETDREIWVKHRASGHVYEFQYLDGSKWASEFTIVPDLSSTVDADSLTTAARRAAREYLKRLQTERSARGSLEGAEVKVEAADFVQSPEPSPGNGAAAETSHQPPPRPPQQPPTGWMGTDDAANRIVQETEAARRRFVAATSSQVVDPIPPQAKTASQFALDASGRIDLVSDSPDLADSRQRDLYAEVRRTAIELSAAGHNQLGDLGGPANVFLEALPDNVEAASIVRVWSRGNTLRLRLSAHDAVDASAEPAEPARLTPLVAAKLSDVVQNFNAFINRDPSGRELDQLRIGPQERNEMLTAMEAAAPIVEAIGESTIATAAVIELLAEQVAAAQNDERATALASRTLGNFIKAALRFACTEPLLLFGKEGRAGVYGAAAYDVLKDHHNEIITFVINNADHLRSFVDTAVHSQALLDIINAIAQAGMTM